jgi:hypothetical protein
LLRLRRKRVVRASARARKVGATGRERTGMVGEEKGRWGGGSAAKRKGETGYMADREEEEGIIRRASPAQNFEPK